MAEGLAQRWAAEAAPLRDRWYGLALARAETLAGAELLVLKTVRECLGGDGSIGAVEIELTKLPVVKELDAETWMPADTWARVSAVIQVEGARRASGKGLNPESVLPSDPLLVPKKTAARDVEDDGLAWSPSARFMVATALAIVLGVGLTIYIVTRKPSAATSAPASATAGRPTSGPVVEPTTGPVVGQGGGPGGEGAMTGPGVNR